MVLDYQTQIQPSPTPVATTDPTSGWKTHTQSKSNIEFRYPSNLTTKDLGNGVIKFTNNSGETVFNFTGYSEMSPTEYKNYQFIDKKTFTDTMDRRWETDLVLGEVFNFIGILNANNKYYMFSIQSNFGEESDEGKSFRDFANQILSTFKFLDTSPTPISKACTMEAKICPDGSSVGRSGPNCEFAPCPTP